MKRWRLLKTCCLLCVLCLATFGTAQEVVVDEPLSIRPYASLALSSYLILPGIEARIGAKGVGMPELELRGDVSVYVPGLYRISTDVLYNFVLDLGSELYAGGGARLFLAPDSFLGESTGVVFAIGIVTGLETPLSSNASYYFEFGGDVLFEDGSTLGIPIVPNAAFGLKLYF